MYLNPKKLKEKYEKTMKEGEKLILLIAGFMLLFSGLFRLSFKGEIFLLITDMIIISFFPIYIKKEIMKKNNKKTTFNIVLFFEELFFLFFLILYNISMFLSFHLQYLSFYHVICLILSAAIILQKYFIEDFYEEYFENENGKKK